MACADRVGGATRLIGQPARQCLTAWLVLLLIATSPRVARGDEVSDFYKGKTIQIQVGYGPGGGYDVTTRLVARFLGEHIPGKPSVVVQNAPGAGSMRVANALYSSIRPDGLTLGVFGFDVALEPFRGEDRALFDPTKFSWIGSMDTDNQYCGVWKGAGVGIKSLPDLIASRKTVTFGASGPAALSSVFPRFFKNALGAPTKVIYGYTGVTDVVLAMRRGELDGACNFFESQLRTIYSQDIANGDLQVFMRSSQGESSGLVSGATSVWNELKTDELRSIAQLVFSPVAITRPLAAPPGTQSARVNALRQALQKVALDKNALEAAAQANIGLQIRGAQEIQDLLLFFKSASPGLIKKAHAMTHTE